MRLPDWLTDMATWPDCQKMMRCEWPDATLSKSCLLVYFCYDWTGLCWTGLVWQWQWECWYYFLSHSSQPGNDLLTRQEQDSQLQPPPPAGRWGSGSWTSSVRAPSRNTWINRRNAGRRRKLSWRRSQIMAAPAQTLTQSLSSHWPHFLLPKQPRTPNTTGTRNVYQ